MTDTQTYDLAITGGGLAGLSLSIQMARKGYSVILFEKEAYPFHRVCGEYISMESWDFILGLGVDLPSLHVSSITQLQVSTKKGKLLEQKLPLGGFGISRFRLDHILAQLAVKAGVILKENTTVDEILADEKGFTITASNQSYHARMAAASYGKRGKLDIKWKRPFVMARKNKLNNYIGIKYHVHSSFAPDTIALHIFSQGYCGLVRVENDQYCLCYLTTAANLQLCGGDIKKMERDILSKNPFLEKIFREATMLRDEPVVISQISFDKKTQVEDHVLMLGDAAGMITPLCGNGMSMALHASKIAATVMNDFLNKKTSREEMELAYQGQWQEAFAGRLRMGRRIQRLFNNEGLVTAMISIGKKFPAVSRMLIRRTHGKKI